jgi:TonB family protein
MRNRQLWQFFAISLPIGLASLSPISAQESAQQPSDSRPSATATAPPGIAPLRDLATQLFHHADKAKCHKGDCTILVMNFVLPDGNTSRYSMQLADELSSEMAKLQKSQRMIDRTLLQSALERQRIPAQLQNSGPVARWLARGLNADVVLVGTTKRIGKNAIELSAHFLNVKDEKRVGPSADVNLSVDDVVVDLYPTNGLPTLQPITATVEGEKVHTDTRAKGMSAPYCSYMPNPSYTNEAREAKFSGVILTQAIVDTDGAVTQTRIVTGAPYGLNASALRIMATWKCRPATYEGRPVPTLVSFEVNFRIY